jgi:hypothetical protein
LASLQPTFTILHTLTTSRAPSPYVSLTWHASSSKQKSDMLATQTADGDLRVWSVSKPPTQEAPRVIRVLRRPDPTFLPGRTWISWSKNGRILQYAETETCSWDVRTKHVTFEPVNLVDGIRALAAYGPTASLFSLGPDHTVQQYDAESRLIVKNVRIVPTNLPPTPPEENRPWTTSESEEEYRSPSRRSRPDPDGYEFSRNRVASPQSQPTTSHVSKRSKGKDVISPAIRSELTGTSFSLGTNNYLESQKFSSPQSARSRRPSRLKQEVTMSPMERPIADLFPFIRARLSDVPYRPPRTDADHMTPDDLRNQMLSTVFGWEDDIWDLIRDELSRHPAEGQHAIFLSKWLDEDPEFMISMLGASGVVSNTDWMILALGTMGDIEHSPAAKKISQVFVEKMLSRGDIHAAVTVLLAIGDKSDAIEVYVSRNQFLEAVLLTCLVTPTDWQRQSHLVRRWGEHVVEKSEQQLAIRCFSCTSIEPTEPWTSPTAQMAVQSAGGSMMNPVHINNPAPTVGTYPDIFKKTMARRSRTLDNPVSIPIAPPTDSVASGVTAPPQSAGLKLITSFPTENPAKFRFPGLKSDDHTPTYGNAVTPIAESAIDRSALSPGGLGSYRMNNARSLNAAMSARAQSQYHRQRLPSIGETPIDVESPRIGALKGKRNFFGPEREQPIQEPQSAHPALTMLPSAKYDPTATPVHETPQTALPQTAVKTTYQARRFSGNDSLDSRESRGSSRSRKPDGLSIQMFPVNEVHSKQPTTGDSHQTTQFESTSELTSPPVTGETFRSAKSPSVSGRSIDQYISSLEQAQLYGHKTRSRGHSASSKHTDKRRHHGASEDLRGRDEKRTITAAKRSPSSPVPMSPEDVRMFSASVESFDSAYAHRRVPDESMSQSSLGRRQSRSGKEKRNRSKSRQKKAESRGVSPNPSHHSHRSRGRSGSRRGESGRRSPSSPLPMVPSEEDRNSATESALRFVNADRRNRSGSRQADEREREPPRKQRNRSRSRPAEEEKGGISRRSSVSTRDGKARRRRDLSNTRAERIEGLSRLVIDPHTGNETQETGEISANPSLGGRKKELAAAELEARRLSLARRPSAPVIPLPGAHSKSSSESAAPPLLRAATEDLLSSKVYDNPRARRPSTPGSSGLQHHQISGNEVVTDASDTNDTGTLPSSVYMTPNLTQSPPMHRDLPLSPGPPAPPQKTQAELDAMIAQLPRHAAYDAKISQSRSSSKSRETPSNNRERSRSRHPSRERTRNGEVVINLSPESTHSHAHSMSSHSIHHGQRPQPPLLPELQHLADHSQPPVPPPPPAPLSQEFANMHLDPDYLAQMPRSSSSNTSRYVRPLSPPMAQARNGHISMNGIQGPSFGHRRGRSGHESNGANGTVAANGSGNGGGAGAGNGGNGSGNGSGWSKFKNMADRMRSTSRGRDNVAARSPPMPVGAGEFVSMPYETAVGERGAQSYSTRV